MEIIELTKENINQYLDSCMMTQKHLVKPGEAIESRQFVATAEDINAYFIGIIDDEQLAGLGVLNRIVHPVMTTGYVNNIVVSPEFRGKGYFRVIMDALEDKAKEWGCSRIDLTCSRQEVQGMYEKRGYVEKDTKFYMLKLT